MTSYVANTPAELNTDIGLANASGTADTITLGAGLTLTADIAPIALGAGGSLVIDGAGFTIEGGDAFHAFFVASGSVSIADLTVSHAASRGGAGGNAFSAGGGGAGLGGGLFIGTGGTVNLDGVAFIGESATGGAGGSYANPPFTGAGGRLGGHGSLGGYGVGGFGSGGNGSATGGFGGGGGGGTDPGTAGGFGAGSGGFYAGGGGLGAGGAIFVRAGGVLSIGAGGISGGSVAGGAAGIQFGGYNAAAAGGAFGSGIFLQGSQTLTLAPGSGQTLTISDAIADQTGSGGVGGDAGAGAVRITGLGRVELGAANTFTGGVDIGGGATLALGATGAAGSGHIRFAAGATLAIGGGVAVANTLDTLAIGNVVDVAGITGATAAASGGTLTISGTGGSLSLALDSTLYADAFAASDDGHGGTAVTYTGRLVASTEAELNADIAFANASGKLSTIALGADLTLTADITPIALGAGATLVIDGAGHTIAGGDAHHGFFVASGSVAIGDLTLSHTRSQGGAGMDAFNPGGGGAGAGGGLFVGAAGTVSLNGVTFAGDSALGGAGGDGVNQPTEGLGGGLGGHGGLGGYGPQQFGSGSGSKFFGGGGGTRVYGAGFGGGGRGSTYGGVAGNFGGGHGWYGSGGGGLGAGGAIFVRQGGRLSIGAGGISGGTATGGIGGYGAGSGLGLGSGLFLHGNQTITLAPGGGETLTISDAIADQGGSGGSGALDVAGQGMVVLGAASTFTGGIGIGGGATLVLAAGGAAGSGHIRFAAGATLAIGSGVTVDNTLDTIHPGDVIDVAGITGATAVVNGSTLTVSGTGGSVTLRLDGAGYANGFSAVDDGAGGSTIAYTACFAAGTRIATPAGEVAVERLRAGAAVCLAGGGSAAVRWMGHRRVDCRRHPRPRDVWPVRVRRDAFGPGRPHRDLVLSPDHAVFVAGEAESGVPGMLVPIRYLVNGATIVQEPAAEIEYWHVELPRHDVILAEGLAAESYLDTGNRAAFANGGAVAMAHPDFALKVWAAAACAPLVTAGPARDAVAARLLARAAALGHATTGDAAPLLLLGRHALRPRRHGAGWRWLLPARAQAGVLVSRSFVPAQMEPGSDDHRRLGIAVARLMLDDTELDLRGLGQGWRPAEPGLRWTDGAATIPLAGARTLTVLPAMAARYWNGAAAGAAAPGSAARPPREGKAEAERDHRAA